MRIKQNLALYLTIAAIAVLFICMLVLCGLYLDLRVNGVSSKLPEIPENDKWILTDSSYNAHTSQGQMVSPAFIGIKSSYTGMIAAEYNEEARDSLIRRFEEKTIAAFNGGVEYVKHDSHAERDLFVEELIASDTYLYAAFYNEIPAAAVITGLFGNIHTNTPEYDFDVRYMFVLPEDDSLKCVCLDDELDAIVLRPTEKLSFDEKSLSAYNGVSGFIGFEFVNDTRPEPMFTESFEYESVIIAPSFSFYNFVSDDINTKKLLEALDFNANLVKTYSSGDGDSLTFVGEEKELHVSFDDGVLYYDGFENGIHMSNYLKYYPQGESYNFNDMILCVKYLINSIDRILVGGDALPSVVGISVSAEGETVFHLKYFYNGIMLTENEYDISVSIEGEYIKSIEIKTLFCDSGRLLIPAIPQNLAMAALEGEIDEYAGFSAIYKNNEATGKTELVWIARKDVK